MKKIFIAFLALCGAAAATEEITREVIPFTSELTNSVRPSDAEGWVGTGWSNLTSANIKTDLDLLGITTAASGNYYFLGNGADDSGQQYKTVEKTSGNSITMTGRQYGAAKDGFFVNVTTVADLLGSHDFSNVTALTLTTNVTVSTGADAWFGLYTLNTDDTWTEIQKLAGGNGHASDLRDESNGNQTTFSKSITLTNAQIETLGEGGKLFAIYRNAYVAKQTLSVNSLGYTLTVVPEPTTATLSLLALAGLAARRRRR
ncbi:MAG: PEP-CTERM sorting domain-containing protein [Akkermansiaceae bacterium]|nr:PEP-CTERM sorting domain-containing protein [Akkermansiaceae bacterium]